VCAECGHELQVDQSLAMETALSLADDDGPCSAKNMTFAQTALYIRRLELRWMEDQRRIRLLEHELDVLGQLPFPEGAAWKESRSSEAGQRKTPTRERVGVFAD
jgi:hypothetical protein